VLVRNTQTIRIAKSNTKQVIRNVQLNVGYDVPNTTWAGVVLKCTFPFFKNSKTGCKLTGRIDEVDLQSCKSRTKKVTEKVATRLWGIGQDVTKDGVATKVAIPTSEKSTK